MNLLAMYGDISLGAEIISFFNRCIQIMAMSCILHQQETSRGPIDYLFVFSCGAIFFMNCLEFSGTVYENVMIQGGAAFIGIISAVLLKANRDFETFPLSYCGMCFGGFGILCSVLTAGQFYFTSKPSGIK